MPDNTGFIGERIRQARRERDMSRDELAARSGVSKATIVKLEQGQRLSASVRTVDALAGALGVPVSSLLDRRDRLEHGGDDGMMAIRDVLLSLDVMPVLQDGEGGEPLPRLALARYVLNAWDLYWAGHLGILAARLPRLITDAKAAEREHGRSVSPMLAQAYQLAANLCVHTGYDDLGFSAARSAMWTANEGNDELQLAAITCTLSWVLLHMGRNGEAEQAARRMAERIEPPFSVTARGRTQEEDERRKAHLTVYGALLLSAVAPAAQAGDADAVAGYLTAARTAALPFTADRHDYQVNFGPTQVAMQAGYAHVMLEQPDACLAAARSVRRDDLLSISWGAHKLDVAFANMQKRRWSPAVAALAEAHSVSGEWFRHQGPARSMTLELKRRHQVTLPEPLDTLAKSIAR